MEQKGRVFFVGRAHGRAHAAKNSPLSRDIAVKPKISIPKTHSAYHSYRNEIRVLRSKITNGQKWETTTSEAKERQCTSFNFFYQVEFTMPK